MHIHLYDSLYDWIKMRSTFNTLMLHSFFILLSIIHDITAAAWYLYKHYWVNLLLWLHIMDQTAEKKTSAVKTVDNSVPATHYSSILPETLLKSISFNLYGCGKQHKEHSQIYIHWSNYKQYSLKYTITVWTILCENLHHCASWLNSKGNIPECQRSST